MRRHIHRYPVYVPANAAQPDTLGGDAERWSKPNIDTKHPMGTEEDEFTNIPRTRLASFGSDATFAEKEEDTYDGVHFALKTNAGTLSYKPSEYSNYTDFLRVIFEMSLTFNSVEVDPEFKKVMKKAFAVYEGTEEFNDEDDDEESDHSESGDIDFVPDALENARNEAEKWEKGVKYVKSLPKSETLTLKILQASSESTNTRTVEKLLMKMTDLPPNIMHAVIHNHQAFSLPFEKASNVYVQLRMLGIPLTVKSDDIETTAITIQKSAAKRSIKKSASNRSIKKTSTKKKVSAKKRSANTKTKPALTGSEKIRAEIGIIENQ